MADPTYDDINFALRRLGKDRVIRAQKRVEEVRTDMLKGSHLLSLGMRETWGQNIEGGAKLVNGRWVKEDDPTHMDVGWLQISRRFHADTLSIMPGVKAGTWGPKVSGKSANDGGYVPTFGSGLEFTTDELRHAMALGAAQGVPTDRLVRFAIAAHNAGVGGALAGFHEGNQDKYTAGGDYSAWVLKARSLVLQVMNSNGWVWSP